ncbi:MAG: arylsulfotransferase family protein [Bacteroidota bacterium]
MRVNKLFLFFILPIFSVAIVAQNNTVGLLSYDPVKAFDGYNLMYPHNQPNVYLLDNCGEIVHVWEDEANFRPGNIAYLTEEGLLYKGKRDAAVAGDAIWAGGGGAILEIRDWDNNLIWDFEMNDDQFRLHHDFAVTAKGTIIALAWELKTLEECHQAGRDTNTLAQNELWPDWIFEIDPDTDEIIWEWHAWDHLIQDFNAEADNFGVIADHPELIDVNYGRVDGHPDWMHANSLDYNDELQQIMISVPYFDEILVIDHTTTTAEAASHNGGFGGRGGDLMFRWGNPRVYQAGDSSDQQLFFQHDAHWVDDFLEPNHPLFGKIAVFNNRVGADFSTANILTPDWDMYNWRYGIPNGTFSPADFNLTYTHPVDPTNLWSTGLSSIQVLPNGNTLITSGRFGYTFELTPDNEIVWEYKTPFAGGFPATQGDTLTINNNLTFRMKRYPADFAAFADRDLGPQGWIELEPDESFCDMLTSTVDPMDETNFKVYPNPAKDFLTIEWDGMMYVDLEVFDLTGRKFTTLTNCNGGRKFINTANWPTGMYLVSFIAEGNRYSRKIIVENR